MCFDKTNSFRSDVMVRRRKRGISNMANKLGMTVSTQINCQQAFKEAKGNLERILGVNRFHE